MSPAGSPARLREALARLDVHRFVLGIHEAALPSSPGIETGRGSLSSRGGLSFLAFARDLGFDGLQLGPGGMTDPGNASPYDATLFSRSLLGTDLEGLVANPEWSGLLAANELERILRRLPRTAAERVPHRTVHETHREALARAAGALARGVRPDLATAVAAFAAAEAGWLEPDATFEALAALHGTVDPEHWPDADRRLGGEPQGDPSAARRRAEIAARFPEVLRLWRFGQFVVARQRAAAHRAARELGLLLYGDLQVGMSPRDAWRFHALALPGYRLGAPPSRTNPEGQPWGYPVLDPAHGGVGGAPGPATALLEARAKRAFADYDALRVDHPHGLVDPWVYRTDLEDPYRAVQEGARLVSSPEDPRHPELGRWAIARRDQIDRGERPWADRRVADLDGDQVARYGMLLDRILEAARAAGREREDVVCEVLSTLPYPLARVLSARGLGRFRVAQKADPKRADDVYRPSNAVPEDWVMLGNHDTPSIWEAIDGWEREGTLGERAADTASRLGRTAREREALAAGFAARPGTLATGMLADLLACPARHVFVFFTDLLGIAEPYNRPGVVDPANWSLRVPPDYRERYAAEAAAGRALDLAEACELALRARGLATAMA